jgi:hypothetical protein
MHADRKTGRWPERITVVGYEMKRERFVSLHRAAIRFPADRFTYIGIDLDPKDEPEAWAGEVAVSPAPPEIAAQVNL